MARRRRVEKPAEVEEEQEVIEQEEQPEGHDQDSENGEEGEQRSLTFDEEISWKPAKPIPTSTLIKRLDKLSKELSDLDQGATDLDSLTDVAKQLGHRNLLQHKDRGVKAYTACCLVDILRLYVPEAPFSDDQIKMIFTLFIKDILPALHNPTNPYDSQHKYVLSSLTEVKSVLLIHQTSSADELLLRLFNSTFDGVSASGSKAASEEQVAKDVEIHLTEMLMQLIDEAESVSASVVDAIISQFLRAAPPGGSRHKGQNGNQSTLLLKAEPPAYIMAKNICNGCSDKMARYVSQYFSDVILNASGFATKSNGHRQAENSDDEDGTLGPSDADLKSLRQAHLLIRELWRAAPTVLLNVVPQIEAELSADNVHLRQIATETIGDMVSGIGAAGPPPPPSLEASAYPPLKLLDEVPAPAVENVLTKPYSPQSFAQTHHAAYRNFVGRRNDKMGIIRTAWASAAGHILATSAGGIGLSREEESELIKALNEKLNDSEEKVRLAAVQAIELFDFRDMVLKLGALGGVEKPGSIFASLADRCRDRKHSVRVDAMVLLGKLWSVGAGEIADGQEAVISCLGGVPSCILNAFYTNDRDLLILLDRVMFECLVPLKYPYIKGAKAKAASQSQTGTSQADQDKIRAERILLMLKSLDAPAKKAFFTMQARQPQIAKGLEILIQQCEAYNGGVIIDANEEKVKAGLGKTFQWFGPFFPDHLKVRNDLQKFAKLNDRRCYQLVKFIIGTEYDYMVVRRAIHELIAKVQSNPAATGCLDTIIPLIYRGGSLMFNRSHLATIMNYSKNDKAGFSAVAHDILNEISQQNPDLFKAHSDNLRKEIVSQAPSASQPNEPGVVDILKAYSSYSKRYPKEIAYDRKFIQVLMDYALHGVPARSAKYAVNLLLAKNDDKSKVTATTLLQRIMKDFKYGSPHFLTRLAAVSQLERLAPTVTLDFDETINDLTIKQILRQVRTEDEKSEVSWVEDEDMNEELQAKCLSMRLLVNQALANQDDKEALARVKLVFKLLKEFVVQEGEFCKVKDTPLAHKKRLRLLAGLLTLKLCTVKKYDDEFDPASFNKLAELIQDTELQVRRHFMEKLQSYITQGRLRARFYTMLFLVAFEPALELKSRVETWLKSRARLFAENKTNVLEASISRLIPLLAHHPDYSSDVNDLADFANYFVFYLSTCATEENISLIYKYAERVKQTRDALNPDASERLHILADIAMAVTRKWQERRNWAFQAWSKNVGLPSGLFQSLPSSAIAHDIAQKQYMPEELDEKLDDLLRAADRKKKRKSVGEKQGPPAKRARTQIKTVIRERREAKPKAKKASKPKKSRPAKDSPPPSERRRSGRAHKVSVYTERDDEEDEEEMLEGVAKWDYLEGDGGESEADSEDDGSELSDAPPDAEEFEKDKESDSEELPELEEDESEEPKSNGRNTGLKIKAAPKPAAKASAVAEAKRPTRATRSRRGKGTEDMELDADE
ncbi:sister chromatid cohesion protein PDS5 [Fusarium austroafricanum]|uniref:Sister chromatid cohesion protein PDS5 n=1 Tax=Fusarium austroafricanum TaxID=2364996 RepID=A0A8H4KRU0_9HYPO|nr:sister chromatid cohesion protein PDS5 [Fusarium austroafricanum]